MVTKKEKLKRLVKIDQEIRTLRVAAITGQIPHSVSRTEITKLEAEREQLWSP